MGSGVGNGQRAEQLQQQLNRTGLDAPFLRPPTPEERLADELYALALAPSTQHQAIELLLTHREQRCDLETLIAYRRAEPLRHTFARRFLPVPQLLAYEALDHGTIRPVARVALAMANEGTDESMLWAALVDAHRAGDAKAAWTSLAQNPARLMQQWAGKDLISALDGDLDRGDFVRGQALVEHGGLRLVDRIRIAVLSADAPAVMAALREADPESIADEYQQAYGESLHNRLFSLDANGHVVNVGELRTADEARARALLTQPENDPDALVKVAYAAIDGLNHASAIWGAVEDTLARQLADPARVGEYEEQLNRLRDVVLSADWQNAWGGLSAFDHARVYARLGLKEQAGAWGTNEHIGSEHLADPIVREIRAQGGLTESTVFNLVLAAAPDQRKAWNAAYQQRGLAFTYFNYYVDKAYGAALPTVLGGDFWQRLDLCAKGSVPVDSYPATLVNEHATDAERTTLGHALRRADIGAPAATPADTTAAGLVTVLTRSQLSELRAVTVDAGAPIDLQLSQLNHDVGQEERWWYGASLDLRIGAMEARAAASRAQLDGTVSAEEHDEVALSMTAAREAMSRFVETRETFAAMAADGLKIGVGLAAGLTGAGIVASVIAAGAAGVLARRIKDGKVGLTPTSDDATEFIVAVVAALAAKGLTAGATNAAPALLARAEANALRISQQHLAKLLELVADGSAEGAKELVKQMANAGNWTDEEFLHALGEVALASVIGAATGRAEKLMTRGVGQALSQVNAPKHVVDRVQKPAGKAAVGVAETAREHSSTGPADLPHAAPAASQASTFAECASDETQQ